MLSRSMMGRVSDSHPTKNLLIFESSSFGFSVSHSHTTNVFQPSLRSFLRTLVSRLRFVENFCSQDAVLDFGL
jgi:hypothetical protein